MVCGQREIELWRSHTNFICNRKFETQVILGVVVSGSPRNHNHCSPSTHDSVWVNKNNWSSHLTLRSCTVISIKHGQEELEVETRDYRPPHQGHILWVLDLWFMPRARYMLQCCHFTWFLYLTPVNYKTWRTHGGERSYCGLLRNVSPCSLVGGSKLFGGTYCLSVQGRKLRQQIYKKQNSCTLLPIYKGSHIPDIIFDNDCREQLRPRKVLHLAGIWTRR